MVVGGLEVVRGWVPSMVVIVLEGGVNGVGHSEVSCGILYLGRINDENGETEANA